MLLSSCTAYQKAQWSANLGATQSNEWADQPSDKGCQHGSNYNGYMSNSYIYSMPNSSYICCYKCGRYVRMRQ